MCSSWTDSIPGIWEAPLVSRLRFYSLAEAYAYLFKIMLHVVDLDTSGGTLEQDGPGVLGQRDGADEDHYSDEHARRRVRVEPGLGARLPDDHGGNDDADVVDGVADDVDENAEHSEIAAGLLPLGHVVTVLCVGSNGL